MRSRIAAALLAVGLLLSPLAAAAQQQQPPSELHRLISGIGRSGFVAGVRALRSSATIRVEKLSSFPDAKQERNLLVQIETLRIDAISALQGNVANNPAATEAVQAAKLFVTQIVAVRVEDDGTIVLYADDL